MAFVRRVSVDGEDVDIEDLTDAGLSMAVLQTEADIVACSLYEGTVRLTVLSDSEAYRKMRLRQLKRKLKSLELEMRKRKLEID